MKVIVLEFFPVVSRPNESRIRISRTKLSGKILFLLRHPQNYDIHFRRYENLDFF